MRLIRLQPDFLHRALSMNNWLLNLRWFDGGALACCSYHWYVYSEFNSAPNDYKGMVCWQIGFLRFPRSDQILEQYKGKIKRPRLVKINSAAMVWNQNITDWFMIYSFLVTNKRTGLWMANWPLCFHVFVYHPTTKIYMSMKLNTKTVLCGIRNVQYVHCSI